MPRTNVQRVDESIAYLRANASPELSQKFSAINKETAGAQISLSGQGYAFTGTKEFRQAVRALLLCQWQYLEGFAMPTQAKACLKSKTQAEVNEFIRAYVKDNPAKEKLAQRAEAFNFVDGSPNWYERKRADNRFGGNSIICYTGVLLWLFQAGYVTIKWYKDNQNMNANNCNTILGAGQPWDVKNIETIPRGMIWNFQGFAKEVCHWGISLGNGRAAGTNNTEKEGDKKVEFERGGGTRFGVFNLRSQYEVLKIKYGSASVRDKGAANATTFTQVTGVETKLFVVDPDKIAFNDI